MTDDADAQILQVFRRQARKNRLVNLVLAERSLILSEAKAPQPDHDVHDGGLPLPSTHDRPNEKGCPVQVLSGQAHDANPTRKPHHRKVEFDGRPTGLRLANDANASAANSGTVIPVL
jgi:hypothetical protein